LCCTVHPVEKSGEEKEQRFRTGCISAAGILSHLNKTVMREKLQLHIPEPCHENWNQMTPVEQGRFCSSCQKNVIDFTAKDDEEILDFFKNYSGNTCGRFSNNQLNRPIEVIELKPASPFLKYAASLLLTALLFSTRGKSQFKEQLPKQVCEKPLNTTPSFRVRMGAVTSVSRNDLHNIKVEGVVMDQKGANVLPHTSVVIKGTNKGTITDLNGKFSLSTMDINGILVFSVVGYVSKELKVSDLILNPIQRILLTPASTGFLGEVIIVGMPVRKKKSIIAGAVTVLKKNSTLVEKLKDTLLFSKIKIYPNPVSSSSTVNLSFPKVKEGLYQIRLLNAAGQLFYSMQKQIGPGRDTEQLHLNSNMAQGIYLIQIIDSDNKLLQTSRLIVQ
jgi:hypothetical protein